MTIYEVFFANAGNVHRRTYNVGALSASDAIDIALRLHDDEFVIEALDVKKLCECHNWLEAREKAEAAS